MKVRIVIGFRSLARASCLLFVLCFFSSPMVAENSHPSRIHYVDGTVTVAHLGSSRWDLLERNFPVWEGDQILSERNSRAEIEFNSGTVVRLSSETRVVFEKSSSKQVSLRLLYGDLIIHKNDDTPFVVYSSESITDLRSDGVYRFSLAENGETTVRVRKGSARTVQGAVSVTIREGDAWRIGGSASPLTRLWESPHQDGFDQWSDLRDALRQPREPSSRPYTRYAGSRDLNRYGGWGWVSTYGRVWWPHEKSQWIPYQRGRWVSDPFGELVWVSDEPWGWLPYHYGSWVYVSYYSRWCWVPGNFYHWKPALVSFYFGGGFLGWAPQGPSRPGLISESGRPRQPGLTIIADRDFRKKRISPSTIVPLRVHTLSPGLPPGLETHVQSAGHKPPTRPKSRVVRSSRSTGSLLRRSDNSSQTTLRPGSTTLVGRGRTSAVKSGTGPLKSRRSSSIVRSRNVRPASSSGKVKMIRHR